MSWRYLNIQFIFSSDSNSIRDSSQRLLNVVPVTILIVHSFKIGSVLSILTKHIWSLNNMINIVVLKLSLDYWKWCEQIAESVCFWVLYCQRIPVMPCHIYNSNIFSLDHLFLNYVFPATWKVSYGLEEEFDECIGHTQRCTKSNTCRIETCLI